MASPDRKYSVEHSLHIDLATRRPISFDAVP